jgi:hypothetical protein
LVGADPNGAKIRSVSASDWTFFIDVAPQAAAAIALTVERIVALYKSLLEIRVLKKQAETGEVGAEIIALIQKTVDKKTEEGLRAIAKELVKQQSGLAKERKNELENHFSTIVRWLAKHIESGSIVEVRAEPIERKEGEGEAGSAAISKEDAQVRELIERVNSTTQIVLSADVDDDVQIFQALGVEEVASAEDDASTK